VTLTAPIWKLKLALKAVFAGLKTSLYGEPIFSASIALVAGAGVKDGAWLGEWLGEGERVGMWLGVGVAERTGVADADGLETFAAPPVQPAAMSSNAAAQVATRERCRRWNGMEDSLEEQCGGLPCPTVCGSLNMAPWPDRTIEGSALAVELRPADPADGRFFPDCESMGAADR
jgi:hypothetical protein